MFALSSALGLLLVHCDHMREQIVVPSQGGQLTGFVQRVYAGSMNSETRDNIVGSRSGSAGLVQNQKEISSDKEAEKEAREEIKIHAKEKIAKEKGGKAPSKQAKNGQAEVKTDPKYFSPDAPLPKDAALLDTVRDLYDEAQKLRISSIEDLPRNIVVRYYLKLRTQAEEKGADARFLKKFEATLKDQKIDFASLAHEAQKEVLRQRSLDLGVEKEEGEEAVPLKKQEAAKVAWEEYYKRQGKSLSDLPYDERQAIREAIEMGIDPRMRSMSGGVEQIAVDGGWSTEVQQEMAGLNASLDLLPDIDLVGQLNKLSAGYENLAKLAVDHPEAVEAMRRIKARVDAVQPLAERQSAEQQRRRGRGDEEERDDPLQAEDLQGREDLDTGAYTHPDMRTKVDEIQEAIRGGRAANNQYLKNKISELVDLRRAEDQRRANAGQGEDAVFETEVVRLMDEVTKLKDLLAARSRDARSTRVTDWSSYGEIRILPKEKLEIVELALTARNPDLTEEERANAQRDIEKRFNQLFSRADARANDEWRDALGNAGQFEVEDFRNALTTVAAGRLTYYGRMLTPDQQDRINAVVNQLSQEAKLREYLHSITYYVNQAANAEQIKKVAAGFKSHDADRAFRMTGVSEAMHLYEQAMLQTMAKNGGYLPYEAMVNKLPGEYGEVESIAKANMEAASAMGMFGRKLDKWEIDRAISIARGMGIMTGRWFEIVAASGIPKGRPLVSWWANKIINKIALFRQIVRYDIGKEQNKMLAYKLEGGSFAWSTKELSEIASLSTAEILDRFVNPSGSDRYVDQINPFRIGSVYTQTAWRWGEDKVNHQGAISHILDGDEESPIIGLGMWIEKLRGDYSGNDAAKSKNAERQLRKQIEHGIKITPLKLFYNLNGLRQDVLRSNELKSLYGELAVYEGKSDEEKGQILIRSKLLEEDLSALALVQEKLLRERGKAYSDYLKKRYDESGDVKDPNVTPPNLLSGTLAELDFSGLDATQASRLTRLAGLIGSEFREQNHYERLMSNLKNKGWKIPFVFGTDDIPHEIYNYTRTGDESFERRWGDIDSVAKAAQGYESLIRNMATFQSQDDIIKALHDIYLALVGHDEGVTREAMERTLEGIIKFYKKDLVSRLPFGIGWLGGFVGGQASYAQLAFGREQMAWDEIDIDTFLKKARSAALIEGEAVKRLRKRTGAQFWSLSIAMSRTGAPLFILGFIYYMLKESSGDLVKKTA